MKAIENSRSCPQCGDDHKSRPYCIYENGAHCFSCGYSKVSDRFPTFREIRNDIPDYPRTKSNPYEFNLENLQWLTKYHVSFDGIKRAVIEECEDGALLFPFKKQGTVIGYQKRWVTGERRILTYGDKNPTIIHNHDCETIVFVEDYISHIRVGELVDCVCLWGTKLAWQWIKDTDLSKYKNFLVWLDNDTSKETNSGQIAADKICNMLESSIQYNNRHRFTRSQKVSNIVTSSDPKTYTDSEISNILKTAIRGNYASDKQ